MKKTIVVGVTGSIAAYKALDIVRGLKREGHAVHVIMTEHAAHLVELKDFEKASGNPVQTQLFDPSVRYQSYLAQDKPMQHISLADEASLLLICPATANVLAKVAHGLADDLLTSTILASNAPVVFAPAMNVKMWRHPATQENIAKLKKMGYYFVDPEYGDLACGYKGVGRLADGTKIIDIVNQLLTKTSQLQGKKIIVTAGATEEPLDKVRVITNRSSGKMGAAIADEAFVRGADVVLIRGKHAVSPRYHFKEVIIETVEEMLSAIKAEMKNTDIIFHTAAVSDFSPKEGVKKKVKSNTPWTVVLEPRLKIIGQFKKLNPNVFLVGFKAEYKHTPKQLTDVAYLLLQQVDADLMVANDVGKKDRGFAVDTNEVYIVDKTKNIVHLPLATKTKIASQLVDYVVKTSAKIIRAFAPASISCFFKLYKHKNPRWAGSYGAGFTVDKGVIVSVARSSLRHKVFFNGKQIDFPTVSTVLAKLGVQPLIVRLRSPLPLGCGFGLSGASALATAYAVNELFRLHKAKKELAIIAHTAEVENKTGLGDVVNQYYGGFLLKQKSSSQFLVKKLPMNGSIVYCRYFSKLPTESVLTNTSLLAHINKAASIALKQVEKVRTFGEIIQVAKEYVSDSGLLRDRKTIATIKAIERKGGHATMMILGNAVLSNIPFQRSFKLTITDKGAHIL